MRNLKDMSITNCIIEMQKLQSYTKLKKATKIMSKNTKNFSCHTFLGLKHIYSLTCGLENVSDILLLQG